MTKTLPSLREKKRYLVFEVIGTASCSAAVSAVTNAYTNLFGALEASKSAITPVKSSSNHCMLSTNRKSVDKLKVSLAMVQSINNSKVILRSVGVSGSLKTAASKYLGG